MNTYKIQNDLYIQLINQIFKINNILYLKYISLNNTEKDMIKILIKQFILLSNQFNQLLKIQKCLYSLNLNEVKIIQDIMYKNDTNITLVEEILNILKLKINKLTIVDLLNYYIINNLKYLNNDIIYLNIYVNIEFIKYIINNLNNQSYNKNNLD